ncbi:Sec-independent protein translocase subunit TatA [Kineococcus aurantiacus]|uniref:Sec-independent protein translocase protein TatA n=1 Tax=Kineococcus aurantiacus TaxID=37633 RepID=A0A7Y9ARV3_9ACTN|nr:Sec-independent protein translocase subunit TatA [Kineococcus aurantiacus]NYD20626.1 sec-independent protein translocase protein TatA [Kineococcus aurantiacus]
MFRNLVDHPWVLVILVVLLIALFGSKRLPDAARGLGRSMRIFKSEVKEMKNDGKEDAKTSPTAAAKDSEPTALEAKLAAEQAEQKAGEHQTRAS